MTLLLYHYTCDHGRAGIGDTGRLVSAWSQIDQDRYANWPDWKRTIADLIWLTDLDAPLRDALGLTAKSIGCDRTVHRYRVVDYSAYSATHYPTMRRDLPKRVRDELERAPGAMPMHWWIAHTPVPVVYDPVPATVAS